jgi:hypothetical protein
MRTAMKFHATRKHQRMRRRCCQGSESAYPFQSDAAKTTKPKASADTSSTLPEFEMWRSTGSCPPSLGSGCSTQLRASAIMSRVTDLRFFEKPAAIARVQCAARPRRQGWRRQPPGPLAPVNRQSVRHDRKSAENAAPRRERLDAVDRAPCRRQRIGISRNCSS